MLRVEYFAETITLSLMLSSILQTRKDLRIMLHQIGTNAGFSASLSFFIDFPRSEVCRRRAEIRSHCYGLSFIFYGNFHCQRTHKVLLIMCIRFEIRNVFDFDRFEITIG